METALVVLTITLAGALVAASSIAIRAQKELRDNDQAARDIIKEVKEKADEGRQELNKRLNETVNLVKEAAEADKRAWKATQERKIRADAVVRSRNVRRGLEGENFAPFAQESWDPKDFRHIGDPVDYIVYAGSAGIKDGTQAQLDGVVLLDIKTGKSRLNKIQRRVRDAVQEGRVQFATYNPDTEELRIWPEPEASPDEQNLPPAPATTSTDTSGE